MPGPIHRLREHVTTVTALLVLGLSAVAFAAGVPNVWLMLVVGLLVVVPIVGLLFGDDEWRKWDPFSDEFWEDIFGKEEAVDEPAEAGRDTQDALDVLRTRYARGDLDDEQFEHKLERLLEAETPEDVVNVLERREREVSTELE